MWKYKTERYLLLDEWELVGKLNTEGANGWEAVSMKWEPESQGTIVVWVYFKKENI